jgi:hypothetical protein
MSGMAGLVQNERSGWWGACTSGAAEEDGGSARHGELVEVRSEVPVDSAGPGSAGRRRSGWVVMGGLVGSLKVCSQLGRASKERAYAG